MQGDLETVSSDPFRLDPLSPSRRADAPTLALDLHRRWCRSGNWYRRLGRDPTSLERVDSILEEGYAVAIRLSEQHIRLEQKPPTSRPARGTLPREVAPGSLPDRTSEYPLSAKEKPFVISARKRLCDACRGQRKLRCKRCAGGTQRTRCLHCDGTGHDRPTQVWAGDDDRAAYDRAKRASGAGSSEDAANRMATHRENHGGSRWSKCSVCSGKGYTSCSECRGKGEVTCNTCDGQGALHDIVTGVRVFRVRQLAVLTNSCGARAKDVIKQAHTPSAKRVLMQPSAEATWQLQRIGAAVAGASGQGPLVVERFQAPCVALRFTLDRTQYRVALLGDLRPQRGKLTFEVRAAARSSAGEKTAHHHPGGSLAASERWRHCHDSGAAFVHRDGHTIACRTPRDGTENSVDSDTNVARPSREQGEQTLFETNAVAYAGVSAKSRWNRGI